MFFGVLSIALLLTSVCCAQSKIINGETNRNTEYTLGVKELQNFKKKTIIYTKKYNVLSNNLNNIFYDIQVYYNSSEKEYYYVLNFKKHPLSAESKELKSIPFEVLNLSVGASPNKNTNSFTYVSSSPVPIQLENVYIKEGTYYLFRSKRALHAKSFQIESIFVNAIPIGKKKIGEKTFREISNENLAIISE